MSKSRIGIENHSEVCVVLCAVLFHEQGWWRWFQQRPPREQTHVRLDFHIRMLGGFFYLSVLPFLKLFWQRLMSALLFQKS